MRVGVATPIFDRTNRPIRGRSDAVGCDGLALRAVDLERLDRALTTILSPLAHERCDDWRSRVESSVAELLDGDHVVFGLPRLGLSMHVHCDEHLGAAAAGDPDSVRKTARPAGGSLAAGGRTRAAAIERRGAEQGPCILAGGRWAASGAKALGVPRRGVTPGRNVRQRKCRLVLRRRTRRALHLLRQRADVSTFATLEPETRGGSVAQTPASRAQGGSDHAPCARTRLAHGTEPRAVRADQA